MFHLPQNLAADELGVGSTALKSRCREMGIARWPWRKLASLDFLMEAVEENCRDKDEAWKRDGEQVLEALRWGGGWRGSGVHVGCVSVNHVCLCVCIHVCADLPCAYAQVLKRWVLTVVGSQQLQRGKEAWVLAHGQHLQLVTTVVERCIGACDFKLPCKQPATDRRCVHGPHVL